MSKGSEAEPRSLCKGTEVDLNWKKEEEEEEEERQQFFTRFLVLFIEKKSTS